MNVSSVTSNNSILALDPLLASGAQSQAGSSTAVPSCGTDISSLASTMNSLQQLQQTDPEKFKQVMASVAGTLETDAANATGSQAQFLSQLASKFQQAAQTGSMSPLEPSGSVSAHHGHHHRGAKSYSAQQSSGVGGSSAQASGTDPTQPSSLNLAQVIQGAMQQVGIS